MNIAEKRYMNYDFRFYIMDELELTHQKKHFKSSGMRFTWMTLDSMYKSHNIIKQK